MKKSLTYLTLSALLLLTSCLKYDKDEGLQIRTNVDVSVTVDPLDDASTRSSLTSQDTEAKDCNIWIYDESGLVHSGYYADMEDIRLENLVVGRTYQVRAVANVGEMTPPVNVETADALTFNWNVTELNAKAGMPMTFASAMRVMTFTSLNVRLKRIAAKYTIVIDHKGFAGNYSIRSLSLRNAPSKVMAFSESKIGASGISAVNGDSATDADLVRLNSGLGVDFFIFENNQGEILSGNSDPWKKEFENHNAGKSSYASKCSYLDVLGDYEVEGFRVPDLRYRIYLGKNSTTNFDVSRNTAYTVVMNPTDAAALDGNLVSWKVTHGTIQDTRSISFSPASITVPSMGQAASSVVVSPSTLAFTVAPGANFSAAGLEFEQDGKSVTVRSGSIVSANTSAKLKAVLSDGKSAELAITVIPPALDHIVVTPSDGWTLAKGSQKSFVATAYYSAGDPADITSSATWTGVGMTASATKGTFTASQKGSASVTATYGGKSASSSGSVYEREVVKTEPYEPVVTIEYADKVGADGSATSSPKVTYSQTGRVTYNDGTSEDVTLAAAGTPAPSGQYSFSGSAKNSSGATINPSTGAVTGTNRGKTLYTEGIVYEARVTLTAEGKSGSATANVYQQANKATYGEWSRNGVKTETVYRNVTVYISASPTSIPASGGTSTLSYGASYEKATRTSWTSRSRSVSYTSGATDTESESGGSETGSWSTVNDTPDSVTGSAEGFSRNGTTVSVGKNTGGSRSVEYEAYFAIAGQSDYDWVTITQAAADMTYSIDANPRSLTWADDEYTSVDAKTSSITCNGTWSVSNVTSGWTATKVGNTVEIYPNAANTTSSDKTGTVTVTCNEDNSKSVTISVTQSAKVYTISVNPNSLTWEDDKYGSGNVQTSTVTCNGTWSVTDYPSGWTATKVGNTVEIYPNAANTTSSDKTGTVTVTCNEDNSKTATIYVTQTKKAVSYSISVNPKDLTWEHDKYGKDNIQTSTVTCNGTWFVSDVTSGWTATKSNDGKKVEIYPNAANTSTSSDKTGTVTVTCNEDKSKTATISVKQTKKPDEYDIDVE